MDLHRTFLVEVHQYNALDAPHRKPRMEVQRCQTLVALGQTLLQEHHNFSTKPPHPATSKALKQLAVEYVIPARTWRHGIHALLELLRDRLLGSWGSLSSFVDLSCSILTLLKESTFTFAETWIECLGDLARHRMAIEDSDHRDRESCWSDVARIWYNEAADKSPNVGRMQHHLAVLARPNIVEQLFYYTKALASLVPFVNARESIMLLKTNNVLRTRYTATESAFVHAFAVLFVKQSVADFDAVRTPFRSIFAAHIDRIGPGFKVAGPQFALALTDSLFNFGFGSSTGRETTTAPKAVRNVAPWFPCFDRPRQEDFPIRGRSMTTAEYMPPNVPIHENRRWTQPPSYRISRAKRRLWPVKMHSTLYRLLSCLLIWNVCIVHARPVSKAPSSTQSESSQSTAVQLGSWTMLLVLVPMITYIGRRHSTFSDKKAVAAIIAIMSMIAMGISADSGASPFLSRFFAGISLGADWWLALETRAKASVLDMMRYIGTSMILYAMLHTSVADGHSERANGPGDGVPSFVSTTLPFWAIFGSVGLNGLLNEQLGYLAAFVHWFLEQLGYHRLS